MGAVQRCFRTKDEMLVFALAHVGERVVERVRAGLRDSSTRDTAGDQLARSAAEISLIDDEHRAEARVWLAFVAQAAVNPRLAAVLRRNYTSLETMFEHLITAAGAGFNARREARTLLALADGLTAHVLVGHLTRDAAAEALASHIARSAHRPTRPLPAAPLPDTRPAPAA